MATQTPTATIVRADSLSRDTRVILDLEEPPHLVDFIEWDEITGVGRTVFSSGEFREYAPGTPVLVEERDANS